MGACIIARNCVLAKRENKGVGVERMTDSGQVMAENVEARKKGCG